MQEDPDTDPGEGDTGSLREFSVIVTIAARRLDPWDWEWGSPLGLVEVEGLHFASGVLVCCAMRGVEVVRGHSSAPLIRRAGGRGEGPDSRRFRAQGFSC